MNASPFKVLFIGHNPGDACRIEAYLSNGRDASFALEREDRLAGGLQRLAGQGVDAVLLDLALAESQGLDTFRQLHAQAPRVPVLVLTDREGDPLAYQAVHEGAQDYLIKGHMDRMDLARCLRYAIERRRAQEALEEKDRQLLLALEAACRSELRHQLLLDSVTDYVYTVQIEGVRVIETVHGPGCVGVTGYTPEEFAADSHLWIHMVPAEDQPAVLAQAGRLLAGQEAAPLEHRIVHKNGSIRWIRNTFVLHKDAQGRVTAYNGLISAITERKQAEESLRNSEALYHSLVESIPLNMFRKVLEGQFTFANQRFCESLGRPLEQILGKTDLDFYPQALAEKYRRDDQKVQATGEVLEDTELHQLASGERLFVAVMKTPVYDAKHRLVGTQGLFWDVTERKWVEEQRAQMRVARAIQQNLLPTAAPQRAGFDFGGATLPAEATGGDYFDYLALNEAVGVVVGDVSGHGFGPALLAAVIHACMRTLARMDLPIEAILATANQLLFENTDGERFATVVCARFDPETRSLVYSSAGHPAGFLLGPSGHVKARLADTGPALGVFPDGIFPTTPPLFLECGDLVLFMSDGVQDAMGPEGAFFGADRALEHVRSNRELSAPEIATALCQAAQAFSHGAQHDDITAVVIKVGGAG